MGISPEYFLDKMSFDEVASIVKANNEKIRREFEKDRMQWFYTLLAPGLSKVSKPQDIVTFEWEKEQRPKKEYSKEQVEKNLKQAKKWLNSP